MRRRASASLRARISSALGPEGGGGGAGAATPGMDRPLPAAIRARLLAAADAGDIATLRAEINAARASLSGPSSLLDQLETLAGAYQLERARDLRRDDHPTP